MFPTDFFITCEIKSINNDSYVIVVESVRKILSISVTDTEKFMYGEITFQEFNDISEKLQLASEKVIDCLGASIRKNELILDESGSCKQLRFQLMNGGKTSVLVTKLHSVDNSEDKAKHIKTLLFKSANQFHTQISLIDTQEKHANSKVLFDYRDTMPAKRTQQKLQLRPTVPGMSIVNPASKRIKGKPGVTFDESDNSDE